MPVEAYTLFGGLNITRDIQKLSTGPHIALGTPGRIWDALTRQYLTNARMVCFVGVDEMVPRGYVDLLSEIVQLLPADPHVQLVCSSTTMPDGVKVFVDRVLRNPVQLIGGGSDDALTLNGVDSRFHLVDDDTDKLNVLRRLLEMTGIVQAIVFCNSDEHAISLAQELGSMNITAELMVSYNVSLNDLIRVLSSRCHTSTTLRMKPVAKLRGCTSVPVPLAFSLPLTYLS